MRWSKVLAVMSVLAMVGVVLTAGGSSASRVVTKATIVNGAGQEIGTVKFTVEKNGGVLGKVDVVLPTSVNEFHGMHLHANAAGLGCVPGGFTEVGGHWDVGGHTHGNHTGDLPSLVRQSDGDAEATFVFDRAAVPDLVGKALIIHAGADNFGNVPLGTASNQYTDNGTAYNVSPGTAFTGNAGARIGCGVLVTGD
ncbi:MAG: superoxide dismutase, Cu-Zn family [Actinomycetota bacterium]|jgi:Cu-Zn family superoxide dismutase|nr:superoxide dismutase, Cu-Zn family [Actinomycetota bacterium]